MCTAKRWRRNTAFRWTRRCPELPKEALDALLYGTKGEKLQLHYERERRLDDAIHAPFEGVIPNLERRYTRNAEPRGCSEEYEAYMSDIAVPGLPRAATKARGRWRVTVGGNEHRGASAICPVRKALEFCEGPRSLPSRRR